MGFCTYLTAFVYNVYKSLDEYTGKQTKAYQSYHVRSLWHAASAIYMRTELVTL